MLHVLIGSTTKEYIPTPYLAILFYLAYLKKEDHYWLRFIYCKDIEYFFKNSKFKDVIIIDEPLQYYIYEDDDRIVKKEEKYYSIKVLDKAKLKNLLKQYIKAFELDRLSSTINYPSFEKQMLLVENAWQKTFENIDKKFNIEISLDSEVYENEKFRICEILFYLIQKKHIALLPVISQLNIAEQYEQEQNPPNICFNIIFLKSPKAIADEYKNWITFCNIKANKKHKQVIYKNRRINFRSDSKSFDMLYKLIENPNENILFGDITRGSVYASKTVVKDYRRNIMEKLKMQDSKKDIICFKLDKNYIRLTSYTD